METYLKWETQTPDADDEDIVRMDKVEVLKDMTKEGPLKGKKYIRVTWSKFSDTLIFHMQSGKCLVVQYDGKTEPVWLGERTQPPAV